MCLDDCHQGQLLLHSLPRHHLGQRPPMVDCGIDLTPDLINLCPQHHLHVLDVIVGHTDILHSIQSLLQSTQLRIGCGHLVQNHDPDCSGICHSSHQQPVLTLLLVLSPTNTSPNQSSRVGVDFNPTKLMMCNLNTM
jgi:hypothetical protein